MLDVRCWMLVKTGFGYQSTNIQNPTSNILSLLAKMGAQGIGGRKSGCDGGRGGIASGMAVAAGADQLPGGAVGGNVVDHVVAADGAAHAVGHVSHRQHVPHLPGDDVIGAGSIAA